MISVIFFLHSQEKRMTAIVIIYIIFIIFSARLTEHINRQQYFEFISAALYFGLL